MTKPPAGPVGTGPKPAATPGAAAPPATAGGQSSAGRSPARPPQCRTARPPRVLRPDRPIRPIRPIRPGGPPAPKQKNTIKHLKTRLFFPCSVRSDRTERPQFYTSEREAAQAIPSPGHEPVEETGRGCFWPASIKVMQRTFNPWNRVRYPGGPPFLDPGGKRSATPLWVGAEHRGKWFAFPKRRRRSAGALQINREQTPGTQWEALKR